MDYFAPLRSELKKYYETKQVTLVEKAYHVAEQAHQGQNRLSGEPYITHPVAVGMILADLRMDPESMMAALLHDVLEDTAVDKETLVGEFGEQVAELVDGLSKLTQIKFESRAEAQAENFRKMVMAMVQDIRIILIKLADRLHNMRTLDALPVEKQKRIARETLEIYAPIANRLGMHTFHIELEELGFQALYPMRYRILKEAVHQARGDQKEILSDIKETLENKLTEGNIKGFKIWGREKHLYAIYKKMRDKRLSLSEIMDVFAFRIIVGSVDACYRVLGIVHNIYKPVPERFKDYIAIPKVNGYQSLHTTLFGPYGIPIEIQIRTKEMNRMADTGIAAHWRYKAEEDDDASITAQRQARDWVKGLLEMQKSTASSLEFIENVKFDLFPDEIYVFTPRGNILELPAGATAVDFAYAVHSDIGNTCVAAKIDRRLAPLSTPLMSGQTAEIITAPGARPNPAWLNFVVTGKARSNIRHYLKKQRRAESIALGKFLLESALEDLSYHIEHLKPENINILLQELKLKTFDDLLENIGLGNQIAAIVARKLTGIADKEAHHLADESEQVRANSLSIKGSKGMVVNFAKCCRPIPGDPIVGILKPGHGLLVHTEECRHIRDALRKKSKNCIPVRWEDDIEGEFIVNLKIEVVNRRGVLAALAGAIADAESNIEDVSLKERDGRYSLINLVITVRDRVHLARVLRRVRRINAVERIIRNK